MVETGALGSVIVKLSALLGDEYTMLKSVRKDIALLERELRTMQILVNMLAGMDIPDKLLVRDCKAGMRDLSYTMGECIDGFMLRLAEADDDMDMVATPAFPKSVARRLKTTFARHRIGDQIKKLKARAAEEGERRRRRDLDDYVVPMTTIDPRLAALHGVAKDLVAIDRPRNEVISVLMEEGVELKVVVIVGGGGLGKTTLAMEAYRKVGGRFQCRACVSVSRTLDRDKLLKDVLSQIDQDAFSKCALEKWGEYQLIHQIQRIITGKRFFLVIDDVWRKQDWESVKAAFPDNYNGSRIVVTTRITKVANSCCSNSGDRLYQMQPLNDVDSRRLFFMRFFQPDNSCPHQLEKASDWILKQCTGQPLAIITIASLLANKPQNPDEWDRLENFIRTGLSYDSGDNEKGRGHISLLSYWDLPHHLKTCLLYLCIYPEGDYISCEELKWKWIVEGFIATKRGNLYQEAESYFNELVNRSMIQLVDVDDASFEQYCQVHDMVHDLIISLSALISE